MRTSFCGDGRTSGATAWAATEPRQPSMALTPGCRACAQVDAQTTSMGLRNRIRQCRKRGGALPSVSESESSESESLSAAEVLSQCAIATRGIKHFRTRAEGKEHLVMRSKLARRSGGKFGRPRKCILFQTSYIFAISVLQGLAVNRKCSRPRRLD